MKVITLAIPGHPVGKGRPRATSRGRFIRMYTDANTKAKEGDIEAIARREMGDVPPWEFPVEITMAILFEPPASFSKKRKAAMLCGDELPAKAPDVDNILKLAMDAMNGIIYKDDKQVVSLTASKRYGPQALTVVTVREYK